MPNDFNHAVIEEFRANQGRVGGPFEGARLLLLTSYRASSGASHTTPLGYLHDDQQEGRVLVIASAGGSDRNPDWFHNISRNPQVRVDNGIFEYAARAVVLGEQERDRAFARAVESDPGWAAYQQGTDRVIPVVALHPDGAVRPNASGWGSALRLLHDAFRRELELIRRELAESGPGIGAQLRINCLVLCGGLEHHHTGEDRGVFPGLAEAHPELQPTLRRLGREHREIHRILEELRHAILEEASVEDVRANVDRLSAELLAHLAYEEEQLIPALDALPT